MLRGIEKTSLIFQHCKMLYNVEEMRETQDRKSSLLFLLR